MIVYILRESRVEIIGYVIIVFNVSEYFILHFSEYGTIKTFHQRYLASINAAGFVTSAHHIISQSEL